MNESGRPISLANRNFFPPGSNYELLFLPILTLTDDFETEFLKVRNARLGGSNRGHSLVENTEAYLNSDASGGEEDGFLEDQDRGRETGGGAIAKPAAKEEGQLMSLAAFRDLWGGESWTLTNNTMNLPVCALLLLLFCANRCLSGQVQHDSLPSPPTPESLSQSLSIRSFFLSTYLTYSLPQTFGHDEINPLDLTASDSRNGWGATIYDSLSTILLMDLGPSSEYCELIWKPAMEHIRRTNFTFTPHPLGRGEESRREGRSGLVSVFESTIRYIGGLLSAYELIRYGIAGEYEDRESDLQLLLSKATELGDELVKAWGDVGHLEGNGSATGLPKGFLALNRSKAILDSTNLAEAGSLILENHILSKYTKNDTYRILADTAMKEIMRLPSPLPGMPPSSMVSNPGYPILATNDVVSWDGGADSYYEYLIKYVQLVGPLADPAYLSSWSLAVDSTIKYLLKESLAGDHLWSTVWSESRFEGGNAYVNSHLTSFMGGNFLLGAKLVGNETIFEHGLRLVDSAWHSYASTATGLGPERWRFVPKYPPPGRTVASLLEQLSEKELTMHETYGYYVYEEDEADWGRYVLRPEVIESQFYAWRTTGEPKYQEKAWAAFESIQKYCKVVNENVWLSSGRTAEGEQGSGMFNAVSAMSVGDVWDISGGMKLDWKTESFFFAETLKYLYLTFADPELLSLDEWVFNTEAHPFRIVSPGDMHLKSDLQLMPALRRKIIQMDNVTENPELITAGRPFVPPSTGLC